MVGWNQGAVQRPFDRKNARPGCGTVSAGRLIPNRLSDHILTSLGVMLATFPA
jgi:hypothetical protein